MPRYANTSGLASRVYGHCGITTNQFKIFNKFVRLNDINDLIKQFIKKDNDYVHLFCMQSSDCSYCKKNSKERWFNYFYSCFIIIDAVFLLIIMYHSASFETWYLIINVVFDFKDSSVDDDEAFIKQLFKLSSSVFIVTLNFMLHDLLSFRSKR